MIFISIFITKITIQRTNDKYGAHTDREINSQVHLVGQSIYYLKVTHIYTNNKLRFAFIRGTKHLHHIWDYIIKVNCTTAPLPFPQFPPLSL